MSILENRIYYVNSENRVAGTPSNFTYHIDIPDGSRYDSACILSMTIPRSYYLVRDGQNQVTLTLDGVANLITVPAGNYNALNFATAFIALLNAVSSNVFTMTFSSTTGKYTYGYTGSAVVVSFDLVSPSRLGHQLGFDEVSTNTFVGNSLVSQNVVDFISTSTLFLHSDLVQDQTTILQEIYSDNSLPFSNLVYNCRDPTMYSKDLSTNTSSTFYFSLTDEHNLEVDLNGHDILFTLLLYRKENLTELIKKALSIISS